MTMFSFHLAPAGWWTTLRALARPPTSSTVPGLVHVECMTQMTLGAAILSPSRAQLGRLAVFARWSQESDLDAYLQQTRLGRVLDGGWHVRLAFLRRWGHVDAFDGLAAEAEPHDPTLPVVAVTLARMKLLQVPRFIRWGRPVEKLVRDHPGKTLALAAIRLPNTVSTFSIWRSGEEMTDMVHGHSAVEQPERHSVAMVERNRKDFHYEFTTLRFRPLSEHGEWQGQRGFVLPVSAA